MAKSKFRKILIILLALNLILISYLGIVASVFFRKKTMPLPTMTNKDYFTALNELNIEYDNNCESMDCNYYKTIIEDDIGVKMYFYLEKEMDKHAGLMFPTVRLIVMDNTLTGYEYCKTFAHEIMHIKHFIQQEDYICLETFKYLYESEELHNVGVWYGLRVLNGFYYGKYDITEHIVDYLTNK